MPSIAGLLPVEADVVVVSDGSDSVVVRVEGLHHHPPSPQAPTRAPRHLGQQLEHPLSRPEIGKVDADVGAHNTYQCHLRQVQSLGHI